MMISAPHLLLHNFCVFFQMLSMSNSPFLWQTPSHHLTPNTFVASLELLDSRGNEIQMNNLVEPFNILLEHNDSSQVPAENSAQYSTQFPTNLTSTLTEDSDPDLYEINTTRSNAAILVTIPQISADNKGQLRMRIRRANQSYSTGSELIVPTTSSFPVSLTWRGLSKRGTYYVSIEYESLSFRRAGRANTVKYSVSFREISCHYWNVSREKWMSNGCKVRHCAPLAPPPHPAP